MKAPTPPANEVERLATLEAYEVLDADPEESFDSITRLAASLLRVPIALISLVDGRRQWFLSRQGLAARETPREVSFCGHVVEAGASMVVPDAFADARFADNPLVTGEPRVRFYAGMALRAPNGVTLGTLCAIDHVPRTPSAAELEQLGLLARLVMEQLEARSNARALSAERAAARRTAARLEVLFRGMAGGVVEQDHSGRIVRANPAAEEILGLSLAQMTGRTSVDPSWRAVHEDGAPFPGETHPAMVTLRTGEPELGVVMGVHKPSGALTWININALPIPAEDGTTSVVTTFEDITSIKAAQLAAKQLALKERLVTTGTLASGVGHEINNPLAFMTSNLDFAIDELRAIGGGSPSGRLRELVEVMVEAREGAERIRRIVRGLRSLAREETVASPTDIGDAVEVAINLAGHELRPKARVEVSLAPGLLVMADESRLSQVLVNLIVNAAQAFETHNPEHNRIHVSSASTPEGRVEIRVQDNGPGIPMELRERIFDPFFTTKPTGSGTGLGLSVSQSIALALGGELLLEPRLGTGSIFRLVLPSGAPARQEEAKPTGSTEGRARVLLIDDEPAILRALQRTLGKEHEVLALSDSREAVVVLERGEVFDVIFCDLMMPYLSGEALFRRVREQSATVAERFVFVTGGATDAKTQAFLAEVPNERVEKPFSVQNLRGIVRRFAQARPR